MVLAYTSSSTVCESGAAQVQAAATNTLLSVPRTLRMHAKHVQWSFLEPVYAAPSINKQVQQAADVLACGHVAGIRQPAACCAASFTAHMHDAEWDDLWACKCILQMFRHVCVCHLQR
jgi:hypothetical protein